MRNTFIPTAALALILLLSRACVAAEPPHSPFGVRDFGAVGDGAAKDTEAVQKAIDACAAAGGGTVFFAPGTYLCGSLHLKSFVTLSLDNGATLLGSPDNNDYDPCEKLDFKNDSDRETTYFHNAFLWGEDLEHVAIVGKGTIDSNRKRRIGPKAIALKRCRYVDIQDIHIRNIPNYTISLLGTDWVNIDGVTIQNAYADGIDPDSCRNVRISNCHIASTDDAIVPKSSFSLGERRACENITVTNCYLSTVCNAFKLGTESGGDFKNITVSNCVMSGLRHVGALGGVALESVDGANVDNVTVTNITMTDIRAPIFLRLGNRGRDLKEPVPGSLKNVVISNVTAARASFPSTIAGIPGHCVEGVILSNIRLNYIGGNPLHPDAKPVPELEKEYPDSDMFGSLPAYGLYCRHVRDLSLANVQVAYDDPFWRLLSNDDRKVTWPEDGAAPQPSEAGQAGHAVYCDDVQGLSIDALRARPSADGAALLHFVNVRGLLLRGCMPPEGTRTFLELAGTGNQNLQLRGNALQSVQTPVALIDGASKDAVNQQE